MKNYLFKIILITTLAFLVGCSTKEVSQTTEGIAYVGLAGGVLFVAPILIPVGVAMYTGEQIVIKIHLSGIDNKKALLSKFGEPDKIYKYKDKFIWEYKNKKIESPEDTITYDVFFLVKEDNVLNYYSKFDNIDEWEKYKNYKGLESVPVQVEQTIFKPIFLEEIEKDLLK